MDRQRLLNSAAVHDGNGTQPEGARFSFEAKRYSISIDWQDPPTIIGMILIGIIMVGIMIGLPIGAIVYFNRGIIYGGVMYHHLVVIAFNRSHIIGTWIGK